MTPDLPSDRRFVELNSVPYILLHLLDRFVACDATIAPHFVVANTTEAELRRLVAHGLAAVNQRNGGRYLSTIARRVGVDRTTVTRWSKATSTASVDHCRILAVAYPDDFDEAQLLELHAAAALGHPDSAADGVLRTAGQAITIGASVHWSAEEIHRELTSALLAEPVAPQNRVCCMTAFHLDRRGLDTVTLDPDLDQPTRDRIMGWREALIQRAAEGWKIRVVVSSSNLDRLETIRGMVELVDGANVEIRAYDRSTPMTMTVLVVANRHVLIAYDHRRWERPDAAVLLTSRSVVDWGNHYFDQVFHDAPYQLRSVEGPRWDEFERLRDRAQALRNPGPSETLGHPK